MVSVAWPAGKGTMMRTGRVGYASAQANRGRVGSAAAPPAKCKNVRRGSFILNLPLASDHSITSSARASSLKCRTASATNCSIRLLK
jgi:hypothetical protein